MKEYFSTMRNIVAHALVWLGLFIVLNTQAGIMPRDCPLLDLHLHDRATKAQDKKCGGECPKPEAKSPAMPTYSFHAMAASLSIIDTPVFLDPPRGLPLYFTITYNQREFGRPREADNERMMKVGDGEWNFAWLSYVEVPGSVPRAYYFPGSGGSEPYLVSRTNDFGTNYYRDAECGASLICTNDAGTIKFLRTMPTGERLEFSKHWESGARGTVGYKERYFLTRWTDPQGNFLDFLYENATEIYLRAVTNTVDRVGAKLHRTGFLIDSVTVCSTVNGVAAERTAYFLRDEAGQLTTVTDAQNLTSHFSYDGNGRIRTMTTPYGTTTFDMGEDATNRWVMATDPAGERERVEAFKVATPGNLFSTEIAPNLDLEGTGLYSVTTTGLNDNNSFFFDKKAMASFGTGAVDYTKAYVYHWLNDPDGTTSGLLHSEKGPTTSRIWYRYAGPRVQLRNLTVGTLVDGKYNYTFDFDRDETFFAKNAFCHLVVTKNGEDVYSAKIVAVVKTESINTVTLGLDSQLTGLNDITNLRLELLPGTENAYPATSLPVRVGRFVTESQQSQVYSYAFNHLGFPSMVRDPNGRRTFLHYADNGADVTKVYQGRGTATYALREQYVYKTGSVHGGHHLVEKAISAADTETLFDYNNYGQVTDITNANLQVTRFRYDAQGFLIKVSRDADDGQPLELTFGPDSFLRVANVTNAQGYVTRSSYDNLDRLTNVLHPNNSNAVFIFDKLDLVLSKDQFGRCTSYSYDNAGRLLFVRDQLGRGTRFSYCGCGLLESLTDPMGRTTAWEYYDDGKIKTKRFPDISTNGYTYDSLGRLKSITDAARQVTRFTHCLDDSVSGISFESGTNCSPGLQARNVSFTYDANWPRVTDIVLAGPGPVGSTHFDYEAIPSGSSSPWDAGKLVSITERYDVAQINSTIQLHYDILGRVATNIVDGNTETVLFGRTGEATNVVNALGSFTNAIANGLLDYSDLPNGVRTKLEYYGNDAGPQALRVNNIIHQFVQTPSQVFSKFAYAYDNNGQIGAWTNILSGNSLIHQLAYDPVDQLLSDTVKEAQTVKQFFGYWYDPAGNRIAETNYDTTASATVAKSRLTGININNQITTNWPGTSARVSGSVTVPTGQTLAKPVKVSINGAQATVSDVVGNQAKVTFIGPVNLAKNTAVTITASDANGYAVSHKLVGSKSVGKDICTNYYDVCGNLIASLTTNTVKNFEWDAAGRLVRVNWTEAANPGQLMASEFTYDALGRRIQIREFTNGVQTSVKRYVWFGNKLRKEMCGTTTKLYFAGGMQITSGGNSANYYYLRDHLGSIRQVMDANRIERARYNYDPYGNRGTNGITTAPIESDFRYAGYFYHTNTGLYLLPFRAYDPTTGKWLSRDPIGENGGINLYAYCLGNPIKWVDPLGLDVFFNEENEVGGHAWVKIGGDSPTGGNTYGAYPNGSLWGEPEYIQSPDSHTDDDDFTYYQYKTTPADEAALEKWIQSNYDVNKVDSKRNPPYRWGWEDCRSFRNKAQKELEKIIKQRGGKIDKCKKEVPKKEPGKK